MMIPRVHSRSNFLPHNPFELFLTRQKLLSLIRIGSRTRTSILGVNLEERLNKIGSGFKILGLKRLPDTIQAIGSVHNGVDAENGVVDARLSEIEEADLGGDIVGESGGEADIGEHVIGVGFDDVEDVGGFLEGGELAVEIGFLGEDRVEFSV